MWINVNGIKMYYEVHGSYIVHKSRIADIIMEETGIVGN